MQISSKGMMADHEIGAALRKIDSGRVEVRSLMDRLQHHAPSQGHGDLQTSQYLRRQ